MHHDIRGSGNPAVLIRTGFADSWGLAAEPDTYPAATSSSGSISRLWADTAIALLPRARELGYPYASTATVSARACGSSEAWPQTSRQRRTASTRKQHSPPTCSRHPQLAKLEPLHDVGAPTDGKAARRTWFPPTAGQTSLFPASCAQQGRGSRALLRAAGRALAAREPAAMRQPPAEARIPRKAWLGRAG